MNTSLDRLPVQLEEIIVEAERVVLVAGRLAEFYRRRKVGHGRYLTAEEIERIPAFQTSDLFRPAQIPPQYNRSGSACGVVLLWTK